MVRPAIDDGLTKFQRYRQARKQSGMKLLRLWLPDANTTACRAQAAAQAALLRGAAEEQDTLAFIEKAADWDNTAA